MKKKILALSLAGYISCLSLFAQNTPLPFTELFCPVDTAWEGSTLVVPQGTLKYNILLKEGDITHNLEQGTSGPLKGGFGGLFYDRDVLEDITVNNTVFKKNTEGLVYLSLLDNKTGATGDGGGYVQLRVRQNAGNEWEVVPQTISGTTYNYRYFDVDGLGGTYKSNGIHLGYSSISGEDVKGNIFMYDGWAESNADLTAGFTNTDNYILPAGSPSPGLGISRYRNMGWITEINKQTGLPVKKLYYAGRADIGGLSVSSSKQAINPLPEEATYTKNLIFTTQTQPAVILRYEYDKDKIYAYKQDEGSLIGDWLMLNEEDVDGSLFPFTFDELSDIRKIALQKGATLFNNLGSIVKSSDGSYYIAETGGEAPAGTFTDPALIYSGHLAHHLTAKVLADGSANDYYGRVLHLYNNAEGKIIVAPYLEGGVTGDGRYTFSNPKKLWYYNFSYIPGSGNPIAQYLIICEEIKNAEHRRNPATVTLPEGLMNEIYFLNLDTNNPGLNDLRPFAIGPKGTEVQAAFSVEGPSPLFLSLRYPNTTNTTPYNKSLLISVNNFEEYFSNPEACGWVMPPEGTDTTTAIGDVNQPIKDDFKVWPNPASRTLYFAEQQKEIQLYDINGRLLKQGLKTKELNIFDLRPGTYLLRNEKGQVKKIVIE